ncbi:MAG: hypothetical protein A2521_03895 [Deltaproteobacteria bacterium RIFOXYD12_FULL_57_12]|nr:MAG: hypothetical protein A2521_03895 [Deltaproteobacteria bacterium RIFOXYD12_FULL_57_12]
MDDRRQHYSLDYFDRGGQERRRNAQNRRQVREEQRQGWIRVSEWTSCYIGSGNMCLAANT